MLKRLTEIRNNIFLGNRLKLFVVAISILIVVLGFVSVGSINKINNRISQENELHIKGLVKLSLLIENIYGILLESHIVDDKSLNENAIENSVNLELVNTYLSEYEQSINNQIQKSAFEGFLLEFQNYLNILREVNSLNMNGNIQLATELRNDKEYKSYKKLQSTLKSMMEYNLNGLDEGGKIIEQLKRRSFFWIYFISFSALIIILVIAIYIFKDIRRSLKLLLNNLRVLNYGQIPENLLSVYKNEIGEMANLTNGLTKNISELNKFANDISKGNYSTEYKFASPDDLLGKALVNLRNSLIISKEEDEKRKIDDERRNWTNRGHAIFGEILRQRSRELSQLTDDIIKNLVYYLKANQGGLFLINDTLDIPKIELTSAFAYDRKKFLQRSINIGDGLIGTVALERNTVFLRQIPEGYIEIESGLGEASPKFLLIVPLKFEEEILGIVELASFTEFLDYEIKFTEEVAQSIASTLLTAKINARTEQLLNESRKQSENLALQEVEARQNIEEMWAAQELAKRREADLTGILSAVDNTLMKGEYELDGTLISVNNRHLQTMGYQLKEIKGKNIEMFVPKDELVHFRKVWANVVAGNPRQLEVRRRTKAGEDLWLINQYTPVTDISGKISKILYLAHDITQYKKSEEEIASSKLTLEQKENELLRIKEKLENSENKTVDLSLKEKEIEDKIRKSIIESNEFGEKSVISVKTLEAINQSLPKVVVDLELNVISVNKKFTQFFKYPERDLINKPLSKIVVLKDKDVLTFHPGEFVEAEPIDLQLNVESKDRQIIPVVFNLIPLDLDKKGAEKIIIYISTVDSIQSFNTEIQDIEKEIQVRKDELKEITDNIKKEKESQTNLAKVDPNSDELYQNWLASIKAKLDKK